MITRQIAGVLARFQRQPYNSYGMTSMPKVFVTQVPHRRDPGTQAFVPAVNVSPASEHGEIVVMMPPRAAFQTSPSLVEQLKRHLSGYDFEAGDSIVPIGDPVIIGAACAILGRNRPLDRRIRVLRWDRNIGRYVPVEVKI